MEKPMHTNKDQFVLEIPVDQTKKYIQQCE